MRNFTTSKVYKKDAEVEGKLQNLTKKLFEREEKTKTEQANWFTIIGKMVTNRKGYIFRGIMSTYVTKTTRCSVKIDKKQA